MGKDGLWRRRGSRAASRHDLDEELEASLVRVRGGGGRPRRPQRVRAAALDAAFSRARPIRGGWRRTWLRQMTVLAAVSARDERGWVPRWSKMSHGDRTGSHRSARPARYRATTEVEGGGGGAGDRVECFNNEEVRSTINRQGSREVGILSGAASIPGLRGEPGGWRRTRRRGISAAPRAAEGDVGEGQVVGSKVACAGGVNVRQGK